MAIDRTKEIINLTNTKSITNKNNLQNSLQIETLKRG